MAARGAASERMAAMEAAAGFGRIKLAQGLGALHAATQPSAPSPLGVIPVQWHRMLGGGGFVPAFLTNMAPRSAAPTRTAVEAAQPVARGAVVSLEAVLEMVKSTAGSAVDADAPLMEAGVDSLGAVELRNQLQRAVGQSVALSSTLMFDHPTARSVAVHLQGEQPGPACSVSASGTGERARDVMSAGIELAGTSLTLPVGVTSLDALRKVGSGGRDLLCEIPAARWDIEQAALELGGSAAEVASRVRHGSFLQDAELFENMFFSVSSAEAAAMDPCSSARCWSAVTQRFTQRA